MSKYDVAVIGAGLGGLAAAALLSCQKKKTIVIERGPSLSDALGVVEKAGFGFYAGTSLSYGFESNGALQEFSTMLGIIQRTVAPSPCYQVALPDRRITVFADHGETLEELTREFPKEANSLSRFYRDLEKMRTQSAKSRISAFFARSRSAAGFMSQYGFSRELNTFFDVQSSIFFQKPAGELSLESFMTLCDTPPRHLQGGFRKLGDQLYGVILQHGGEIRYNEPSPELIVRDNQVTGVKTAQGALEASTLILNTLPYQMRSMLFVGLREEVVPVGMSHDVFLLQDYSRPQEIIALSLSGTDEEAAFAPTGMRAMSVSFRYPQKTAVDKQMAVEKLGSLIPFLKDYVVFAEEFRPEAGHTMLPDNVSMKKPVRSKEGVSLLHRTSQKSVFVLHDLPEAPLQVLSAVQGFTEKLG